MFDPNIAANETVNHLRNNGTFHMVTFEDDNMSRVDSAFNDYFNKLFDEIASSSSVIKARDKIFEDVFDNRGTEDSFYNHQPVSKIKKKRTVAAVSFENFPLNILTFVLSFYIFRQAMKTKE